MGLLVVMISAVRKRRLPRDQAMPFGPFIASGFFLAFLWSLIPSL
jgi:prepilin signal peptidase PulO-like enzyme (type II secretory pathway)